MKWELIIGTIGIIITIILVVIFVGSYNNQQRDLLGNSVATTNTNTTNILLNSTNASRLTEAVVAQHASASDCWIIVQGSVYAVSNYLSKHPGGRDMIIPYCGKDATAAFATKGGQGQHSNEAEQLLSNYLVGALNSSVTQEIVNTNTNSTTSPTTVTNTSTMPTNSASSIQLDSATVAKHSIASDCWIIINSGVYAVTNYLNAHPGGRAIIIPYCGKDATTAFATQGGKGQHSTFASQQLAAYKLGTLNSNVTPQTISQTTNTSPSTTTNSGREDNEQEDD